MKGSVKVGKKRLVVSEDWSKINEVAKSLKALEDKEVLQVRICPAKCFLEMAMYPSFLLVFVCMCLCGCACMCMCVCVSCVYIYVYFN